MVRGRRRASGRERFHGYLDDFALGADLFTGHFTFESVARAKVTDLEPVEPVVVWTDAWVEACSVQTPLDEVGKLCDSAVVGTSLRLTYDIAWPSLPPGSFRLGYVTLLPAAYDNRSLAYRAHSGGRGPESFRAPG